MDFNLERLTKPCGLSSNLMNFQYLRARQRYVSLILGHSSGLPHAPAQILSVEM